MMGNVLEGRFCSHRGDLSAGEENSYAAIKAAVDQEVFYVEFDVMRIGRGFYTGHPPSEPVEHLEDVLPLFEGYETFPKIDLKLGSGEQYRETISALLTVLKQFDVDFVLLNLAGLKGRAAMEAECYLMGKGDRRIRLNIDPHRYQPFGEVIDENIDRHIESLGSAPFSISPEIHREHHSDMGELAQRHGIQYVCFWLFGLPDEPHPQVSESTLRKALELEARYDVTVLFDMDRRYVR